MSVKQQATNSVIWSAVERFSVQGVQFLLSIVIARMLAPSDYGLIAMLSIFMAIAQSFVDSGFANALIQKKNRTEVDYSTVFYFNIVVAVVIYLVLFFSSPLIAAFYDEPQLVTITRVFSLALIINSFGIVQQAKLTIALDFKRQAMASLTAVVLSGAIGVWMAYAGYGVWTLVIQSLLNYFLRVVLMWIYAHWVPCRVFSWQSFRELFAFGSKLVASTLLHTLYTNLYTLIIGKKFAASDLGYYNRAFTLAQFPSTNFTNVIVRAVYPIQCRLQDDNEQLCSMFLKYMRMSCFAIFPVMILLAALAEPLVRILLTDKWIDCVPYLQAMCIAYMWDPVMKINHNMLNVKGRSDYFLYAELIKKAFAFAILFATIPFGILVMCMGLILYSFCDIVIITYYTRKLTGISLLSQIVTIMPVVLLSFSAGAVAYITTLVCSNVWVQLIIGGAAGAGFYFLIAVLLSYPEIGFIKSLLFKKR